MKIKVKLKKYNLDTSNDKDAKKYKKIKEETEALSYELFDCINPDKYLSQLPDDELTVETDFLFDNQYNTEEGFRVFDWYETIYPDKRIKEGYYLTGDIKALQKLKSEHYVCGYCGNRHQGHDAPLTCSKCLGSKYLTEELLPLLVMQPLTGPRRKFSGPTKQDFEAAQVETKAKWEASQGDRLKKKARDILAKAKQDKEDIDYEAKCKVEALNAGLDVDNLIYYTHTKGWCLGWRKEVSQQEAEKWLSANLSFNFEIKQNEVA